MANYAPITIEDGKAAPEAHTYNQSGPSGNWLQWVNRVDGRPDLESKIKARLRAPSRPNQPYRVDVQKVLIQTFTNAAGELEQSEMNRFDGTFTLSAKSETASRTDLRVMTANLLSDDQISAMIDSLAVPY